MVFCEIKSHGYKFYCVGTSVESILNDDAIAWMPGSRHREMSEEEVRGMNLEFLTEGIEAVTAAHMPCFMLRNPQHAA